MPAHDSFEGIHVFVQVVEAGSFTLAAAKLNLTRSAVGKSIARLEDRLGVRLLQRNTRRQALTLEGQAYFERCVRALSELEAGEVALESGRIEPAGRLRVSLPEAFGQLCVTPVLLDLTRQYHHLEVDFSFSDRFVDLIEEGFDLAVRIGELNDSSTLVARRLGTQYTRFCAAPAYLAKYGTPTRLEDLTAHTRIAYSRAGIAAPWEVPAAGGHHRQVSIPAQISMDDVQAIAAAAVGGFGLAGLPSWLLARYVKSGELVPVLESYHPHAREIYAVWPQERFLRCKTRVAIDALAKRIPPLISA